MRKKVQLVGHSHEIIYITMHGSENWGWKQKSECEIFGNHERENDDFRFWDVMSYRLFGGTCYLHLRGRRYSVHRKWKQQIHSKPCRSRTSVPTVTAQTTAVGI